MPQESFFVPFRCLESLFNPIGGLERNRFGNKVIYVSSASNSIAGASLVVIQYHPAKRAGWFPRLTPHRLEIIQGFYLVRMWGRTFGLLCKLRRQCIHRPFVGPTAWAVFWHILEGYRTNNASLRFLFSRSFLVIWFRS